MKLKRIMPLIALVIAAILCFTSCSGSNRAAETETSGRLDLDYVENENAMQAEPEATERPWYAFITDAFSFGTANKGSTKAAALRAGRRADGAARKERQANGCVQHGSDAVRTADRNAKAGRKRHERARTERNARSHSRTHGGA